MSDKEREDLGEKCISYVKSEFSFQNTVDMWHESLTKTIEDWKAGKSTTKRFELTEI